MRDDDETTTGPRCLTCAAVLTDPRGRQAYCNAACRQKAWRARTSHTPAPTPIPTGRSRRDHGIYQCPNCQEITLGVQRCEECNLFGRRIGTGGPCPHCDLPVTIEDLISPT